MLAGQEIKQFDAGITHALELQGSAWTAQNQEILALRDDDAQKMLNALQMVRNFCSILVQFLADDIALSGWTATKTILITEMPSIYSIIFPSRVARSPPSGNLQKHWPLTSLIGSQSRPNQCLSHSAGQCS
jgi:hypothetical protein